MEVETELRLKKVWGLVTCIFWVMLTKGMVNGFFPVH